MRLSTLISTVLFSFAAMTAQAADPSEAERYRPPQQMGASPEAVAAAARPGDEALTCEQIYAEIAPAGQAVAGAMQTTGLAKNAQAVKDTADRRTAEARAQSAAGSAANIAASILPGGNALAMAQAQAAYARTMAQIERDRPMREALAQSTNQFMDQTNAMLLANPRIQHLMQLMEKKGCTGR